MSHEPAMPPASLIAAPAAMLAIHAIALVASTHTVPTGPNAWAKEAWGPYNITAALLLLALLALVLRKFRERPTDPQQSMTLLGMSALDMVLTIALALFAFDLL